MEDCGRGTSPSLRTKQCILYRRGGVKMRRASVVVHKVEVVEITAVI